MGPSPSDISRGSNVHVGHRALHLPSLCDVKCQPAPSTESKVSLHSNASARRSPRPTPKAMFLLCRAIKAVREGKFIEPLTCGFLSFFHEVDGCRVVLLRGKPLALMSV